MNGKRYYYRLGGLIVGEKDVAVLDPDGEVDRVFRGEIAVENRD